MSCMQATTRNKCMYQAVQYMADVEMFSLDFQRHEIVAALIIVIQYTTKWKQKQFTSQWNNINTDTDDTLLYLTYTALYYYSINWVATRAVLHTPLDNWSQ